MQKEIWFCAMYGPLFFYHPFLLTTYEDGGRGAYPGDPSELQFILREIKKLGYRFINLDDFLNKNTNSKKTRTGL